MNAAACKYVELAVSSARVTGMVRFFQPSWKGNLSSVNSAVMYLYGALSYPPEYETPNTHINKATSPKANIASRRPNLSSGLRAFCCLYLWFRRWAKSAIVNVSPSLEALRSCSSKCGWMDVLSPWAKSFRMRDTSCSTIP
ncbi:hypothetical protein AA313_de0210199 [Arthrobotrys entomopaga]|nr:hypothetical protein AA313_de0210199 [Arthrobotrys entomopaga]